MSTFEPLMSAAARWVELTVKAGQVIRGFNNLKLESSECGFATRNPHPFLLSPSFDLITRFCESRGGGGSSAMRGGCGGWI